jgi:hypothetical protein
MATAIHVVPPDPKVELTIVTSLPVRFIYFVRHKVFDVPAETFLAFARDDMKENTPRARANALTNARRAIGNRVDVLLYWAGLFRTARRERWNFPVRISKLQEIGFSTPSVLNRLAQRPRNLLDHEYVIPSEANDVDDIIGIAELYLGNTERYLSHGVPRASIHAGQRLAEPPKTIAPADRSYDCLEIDRDSESLRCYSAWATVSQAPVKQTGVEPMTALAQVLLSAFLKRSSSIVDVESEEKFLEWSRGV